MSDPRSTTPPEGVTGALVKILKPLVKLLIHFRITYPFLSNLLKEIYVQIAAEEFSLEQKSMSDSRISLLTGVHRKDVKYLLHEKSDNEIHMKMSLGSQIIGAWLGKDPYVDANGQPRPLFRLDKQGKPSFESLVESVGKKDLHSRVVLDEYLQSGAVRIDENDQIHLNLDAFIPAADLDEKTFFFGQNVSDHLAVCEHNLLQGNDPRLERCVYYEGLSEASIEKLEKTAKEASMQLLTELNRAAIELQQSDAKQHDAKFRMNFGVYFFKKEV